jgi:hypothetical protein
MDLLEWIVIRSTAVAACAVLMRPRNAEMGQGEEEDAVTAAAAAAAKQRGWQSKQSHCLGCKTCQKLNS